MGCGASKDPQTRRINEFLREQNRKNYIKILLLGAGESGKSTIFKQMKILHMNGFSLDDRVYYRQLIRQNTVQAIHSLISAAHALNIPLEQTNQKTAKALLDINVYGDDEIPNEIHTDIITMWKDAGIKKAFLRRNQFQFPDSGTYFFEHIVRTFAPDYEPTDQDILRSRIATTGIQQIEFNLSNAHFRMFDVGGQRGERKKWIHCFDKVTAILFITSLSEYDQVLAENRHKKRLAESLLLFRGIANLQWFEKTPIILFLNKDDLFRAKIKEPIDIATYFPHFADWKIPEKDRTTCEEERIRDNLSEEAFAELLEYHRGLTWIAQQYYDCNEVDGKEIYTHVTNATNTDNINFVWNAAKSIILSKALGEAGLAPV